MVWLPKFKLLKQGIIIGCLLCAMLLLVNVNVYAITEYKVEESRSSGEVGRGSTYTRKIDLQTVKYPIYIHWDFINYGGSGDRREDPSITINIYENGSLTNSILLVKGSDSYSGILNIPAESLLEVLVNVGERRSTHHGKHHYYGNGYSCKISYILDEQPPNVPETPQITSIANGTAEGDVFYTNSALGLTWLQTRDNGSIYYEKSIISGMKDYIVEGSTTSNDSNSSTWDVVGHRRDSILHPARHGWAASTVSMPYNGLFYVRVKARDHQGNISVPSPEIKVMYDTIAPTVPGVPKSPSSVTAADTITWTWAPSTDATSGLKGYKVYVETADGSEVIANWEYVDTNSFTHTVADAKTYICKVKAIDKALNETSEAISTENLIVDRSAPVVNFGQQRYPIRQDEKTVTIYWPEVTGDYSGIKKYQVALTKTGMQPDSATTIYDVANNQFQQTLHISSSEETYYAWVRAIDNLGNTGVWASTGPFPVYQISGPMNGLVAKDQTQQFKVTQRYPIKGDELRFKVYYQKDGGVRQNSGNMQNGTVSVTFLEEGKYQWWLEIAEYSNGSLEANSNQITEPSTISIDATAPTGSFTINSSDGTKEYSESLPTKQLKVRICNINVADNLGQIQSGVKEIYIWNGVATPRPPDASYIAAANIPAKGIDWQLPDQDGICQVNMQIEDAAGNTTLVTKTVILDRVNPGVPGNFSHTQGNSSIQFNWQASLPSVDALLFRGTYQMVGQTPVAFEVKPSDTKEGSQTVPLPTNIGANQPVKIAVYTIDAAGNQSASGEYTAYTKAALGTLQDLAGGYELSLAKHFLKWQLTSGAATSNLLEYGSVSKDGFTVLGSLSPDTNGLITHSGLTAHGTYYYRFVAINGSNDRTEGPIFNRQVPNTAPSAPVLQAPLSFGRNGSEFKFTPATDVDGDTLIYHIYLQKAGGNFTELNSSTANGLVERQTYSWYVVADDGQGGRTQSGPGQFTIDNTPPTLTVETAHRIYTNQTQLTVNTNDTLSWIAKVSYQKIAADTNTVLASGTIDCTGDSAGNLTGRMQLEEGNYHLQITAWDKAGNSTPISVNNLKVDQTAPQLSQVKIDLTQANGSYLSTGTIPVQLNADDSYSGVNTLRYWILSQFDGQLGTGQTIALSTHVRQYAQKLSLSGVSGQKYYLAVAVEDAAGNRSPVSRFGPFLLELTAPAANLVVDGLRSYGSGYYLADLKSLDVDCQATDAESGIATIKYSLCDAITNQLITGWDTWENVSRTALTVGNNYYLSVKAVNQAGLETQAQSVTFTYDNTAPQNLKITGPNVAGLVPGEQVVFTIAANEPESALVSYRLALGTAASGSTELSAKVTGNIDGWLVKNSNSTSVQFRFQVPVGIANGSYYPIVEVTNAAGLVSSYTGTAVVVDNTQEKLTVGVQGPYTQFGDRLIGWWQYLGNKTVTGYQYRIIDQDNQSILDWTTTTDTEVTASSLNLVSGKQYFFQVKANCVDGTSFTGASPGVIVDTTAPENISLTTPKYANSSNLNFKWQATDVESGIEHVWVALGSDYYQTDITGGWVEAFSQNGQLTRKVNGEPLQLQNGHHYYLTLRVSNGSGLLIEKAGSGIIIDDTPPPTPTVIDQGAYINPARQPLIANWHWSTVDPESGLTSYQWALLPYGADLATAHWTDVGTAAEVSTSRSDLIDGATYYFAVKATNQAGLSSIGYSNGIMMDKTAPIIPTVTLLQAINLGNKQEAFYISNSDNLTLAVETYDLNGVNNYQYTYDSQGKVVDNTNYNSSTQPQIPVDPNMKNGEITVFKSVCSDGAVNISQAGYSAGVILDTGAPQIKNVHGSVSGNTMMFDWDVMASAAPVAFFEYALVPEAKVNATPGSWTKIGLQQSITIDGTNLADGNYRLIVRGCSAAGVYSRRQGTTDEWGVSPKITLDRKAPVLDTEKFSYPIYAAKQMAVGMAATDELSGIGGYQYTLGSKADPQEYSNGWVDVAGKNGTIQFMVPTDAIPHASEAYLMVRARDQVGLWSTALTSSKILVDHTVPVTPTVKCSEYNASLSQMGGISYQTADPESKVTHYRIGLVKQKGGEWLVKQETLVADFTGILAGLTLEEGQTYYIAVQTRNGAGEWSEIGYSSMFTADTIVPELSFTKVDSTIVLNTPPINIEYSLTETANLQFTVTGADGSAQQVTTVGHAGLNYFTFTPSKPQLYQVSVIPADMAGNVGAAKIQAVRVNTPPQITLATFDTTPGAKLKLSAMVVDPDGIPVTYNWDTGDGGATLSGAEPIHAYSQTGTYNVTLTVTDNDGGVSTATTTVTVSNTTKGSLQGDEIWSGIYRIYGDVTVPSGIKLTIKPGTQVIVDGSAEAGYFHALIINGTMVVEDGGASFTSVTGKAGGWRGINVNGVAILSGATLNHAERGVTVNDTAHLTIDKGIFENNLIGLHVYNAKPAVGKAIFRNNLWYGIKEDAGGRPVVTGCQFGGNDIDYYHQTLTAITIEKVNQLDGNSGNSVL